MPRTLDLSEDIKATFRKASDAEVRPGEGVFDLNGMCRVQSRGASIEIELIEQNSSRRTIIYAGEEPSYLILPKGRYHAFYRVIEGSLEGQFALTLAALGPLGRANVYMRKLTQLGLDPKRWIGAMRSRRVSRSRAVGLSLSPGKKRSIELSDRAPISPVAVPLQTAVSIIIPTKVRHDLLRECVTSLGAIIGVQYEIIVVDNGAEAPAMLDLLQQLESDKIAHVVRHDIPFNFSTLCNLGASIARHPLLLFLNDDVEALDGTWLASMCGYALREDVGAVGARLLYPSGDLQHGGIATHLVPGPGHPWRNLAADGWAANPILSSPGEVDAVTGACLLIRRSVFNQVGGFDEIRFAVTLNDVDLCLKTRRAGLKVIYDPGATLLHKEGQSRPDDEREDQQSRHAGELRAFLDLYPDYARQSVFYPKTLRRDTEAASPAF